MNICLFSSSSENISSLYQQDARQLGEYIGSNGYTLVYGGANVGLMEVCAEATHVAGGLLLGIIPDFVKEKNLVSQYIDEVIFVGNLAERKEMMMEYADIFVVLPGGFGTFDEVFEVLSSAQIGTHDKKVVFLNSNGFYNDLLRQLEKCFVEKFIDVTYKRQYLIANTVEECISLIEKENKK